MKIPERLSIKLFSAFIGLTVLILAMTLVLAHWSFRWGFINFIHAQEQQRLAPIISALQEGYASNGSWLFMDQQDLNELSRQQRRPNNPRPPRGRPPPRGQRPDGPRSPGRPQIPTALFDNNNLLISGAASLNSGDYFSFQLVVDEELVGELRSAPKPLLESQIVTQFSRQQTTSSIIIGVICLVVSLAIAWLLTQRLIKPIRALQTGVSKLANGEYGIKITSSNKDELGRLVNDINALSQILADNRAAKNRWFANISHELRTPLTVLSGEIEAVEAGIRPLTVDTLKSINTEVSLLRHLVNDLYDLSLTEVGALKYNFVQGELNTCIAETLSSIEPSLNEAGLRLQSDLQNITFNFDPSRIKQVILNVIANSIKYTHAPGEVSVQLLRNADHVKLIIEDSAPSCDQKQCDQLFEPLFCVDEARTRNKDGRSAGLGLAIVKNIVEAHKGTVAATPSALGGLKLLIQFSLEKIE